MKFKLQFIPQFVSQMRDAGNYVLKAAYDAFANDIAARVVSLEAARVAQQTALGNEAATRANADIALQNNINARETAITAGTLVQYWRGDKSWATLNAAAVAGLGDAATKNVGTTVGTVADGAHLHDARYGQLGASNTWAGQQKFYRGSGSVPLWLGQLQSSTGAVRDAATIDAVWTDATDATRTSYAMISTVKGGGTAYERVRFGGAAGTNNYGIRVLHNEPAPNQTNVAAYFEAGGGTFNTALQTGNGRVVFGGQVTFDNNYNIDAGNTAVWGLKNTKGNLYVADKTNWAAGTRGIGGTIVLAGDDRGQATTSSQAFARIRGVKENTAYLGKLGSLVFGTQTLMTVSGAVATDSTVTDWMWLTSAGVLELKNTTAPGTLIWGDGAIWIEAGALKYRGSSGSITILAPA